MEEFRQAILSLSRYTQQHPIQRISDHSPTTTGTTTGTPPPPLPSSSSSSTTTTATTTTTTVPGNPAVPAEDLELSLRPSLSLSLSSSIPMNSSPHYGFHEQSLELLNLDSTPVDDLTRQRVYHTINTLSTNEDMLRTLFNGIDFNGTGYIDYSEFLAACLARKEGLKREYAELIFEL